MFTGIVQIKTATHDVQDNEGLKRFAITLPSHLIEGVQIGASVAIDGVCLTVTTIEDNTLYFDAIAQTLEVTTLGQVSEGYEVNVERSARFGDEVGGHIVSGHIDTTAKIVDVEETENNRTVWYEVDSRLHKYIFERGFIALNGCSLTVAKVNEAHQFAVCYIPETLRVTCHVDKGVGDKINVEIDRQTQAIVDTVEATMARMQPNS